MFHWLIQNYFSTKACLPGEIDLDLLSRFVTVYSRDDPETAKSTGGIIGLDLLSNLKRGVSKEKSSKKKKVFNNQATTVYRYYDFREVNIKIFNNGRLQMTGIKSEDEAKLIGKYIINQLKTTKIKVYKGIASLPKKGYDGEYVITYNPKTEKCQSYRWNYFQEIKDIIKKFEITDIEYISSEGWVNLSIIQKFTTILQELLKNYKKTKFGF